MGLSGGTNRCVANKVARAAGFFETPTHLENNEQPTSSMLVKSEWGIGKACANGLQERSKGFGASKRESLR